MNPLTICVLAGALAVGGGEVSELIRKDKAALQGTWKVTSAEDNGEKVPADDIKDLYLIFKGDAISIREGGKTDEKFAYLLNPAKTPSEIDMIFKAGPKKGQIDRGIYKIDGDTLRICIQSNKDSPRPRDFVTRANSNLSLVTLQRSKQ
jgi:uncharacterized protein (TIGR03067 family)